jgi:hypothetical protein
MERMIEYRTCQGVVRFERQRDGSLLPESLVCHWLEKEIGLLRKDNLLVPTGEPRGIIVGSVED